MDNCPFSNKPCDKAKIVYVSQNINGKITEGQCCHDCVKQAIPSIDLSFASGFLAMSTHGNLLSNYQKLESMERGTEMPCPCCGFTLLGIQSKGRLGCPTCYDTFKDQIDHLMPQIQAGGKRHQGKKPKYGSIEIMKKRMQKAIAEEQYEEAAILRDRIKTLEQTINGNDLESPK